MVRADHTYCRGYTVAGLVFAAVLSLSVSAAAETFFLPAVIDSTLTISREDSPCALQDNALITPTGILIIEAGVSLYLHENTGITVQGQLAIQGTADDPVNITSAIAGERWNPITSESGVITLDHVIITDANAAIDQSGGTLIIRDCSFASGMLGEVIHAQQATVTIERSTFGGGQDDIIDLESVSAASITDCTILSAGNDGIDIGESSKDITITDTRIYGCVDKGISVGQSSIVTIADCVIADSQEGVTVFDGATANIDRSTIIGTEYGIRCKEDDTMNHNGGIATVTNTIISGTVSIDTWSTASFSHCLSDITDLGTGTDNVYGNPQFYDKYLRDFRLLSDSPAIDAGSPELGADPDGSPADIGAFTFVPQSLIINEINYASSIDFDTGDWIELANTGTDTVRVAGWALIDGDNNQFDFPRDAFVVPDGFLVICRNIDDFASFVPDVATVDGELGFGFDSSGELICLMDGRAVLIDSLTFGPEAPWPTEPNGTGATLSLINPHYDNSDPANWAASSGHGTPGSINEIIVSVESDLSAPAFFSLGPNYPNPFNSRTVIPFTLAEAAHVSLEIYSPTGQRVAVLIDEELVSGIHSAMFEPRTLATGCYIVSLTVDDMQRTNTVLYLK